ncbi:MAG: HAD-IC family P-type ATPase [Candidatus Brennerbacteria bacterium]|nr:HAD-IC family P-type ATPase [Candidatus Brennerbacteria bacterium]
MPSSTFHIESVESALAKLATSEGGLSRGEVARRLEEFGPNRLPEKDGVHPLFILVKQFHSAFVYILVGAGVLSYLFNHLLDVYVIAAVIVFNALIGFFEELKAENAIQKLKKLLVLHANVYRGGELARVPAEELVPGDIVVLGEGDRVPADARLIEAKNLRTEEASLTGESFPVSKTTKLLKKETPLADQSNMVWMGTAVVGGEAKAAVVATGERTAIGEIASSILKVKEGESHFAKKTRELALAMGVIAAAGAALTFLIGFFVRRLELFDIFLFSVASLVSGIPEGLPAVLAVVLSVGAYRMAKKKAIVRRLPAVETLGVATVIATDKTGTVTENSMMVEKIILPGGEEITVSGSGYNPVGSFSKNGESLNRLLHIAALCNNGKVVKTDDRFEVIGDPTEAALFVLAEKAGLKRKVLLEETPLLDELPFDEETKYRAVLVKGKRKMIYVVGAFENIIALSDLEAGERGEVLYRAENLAGEGMRVLALGYRKAGAGDKLSHKDIKNLKLAGVVGMIDPPRPGVKEAVRRARRAGLRVIMKTGDHKNTAVAVAKEIGLVPKNAKPEKAALTEDELLELLKFGEEQFEEAVRTVPIFARVTPKMKLRIVETLKKQGETVAMTGDGVNDAPALKRADIGIAMGLIGTDVARETSKMVLADDNFATIVNAIEEGRIVFKNVRQTSFYLVTTNVAEAATIITTLLFGLPLPLLPIHVLWLNLISDGIPTVGLALEPGAGTELGEAPRKAREKILSKEIVPYLLFLALLMVLGTVFGFAFYLPAGIEKARTVAFTLMAFFQLWNVFNMRSLEESAFKIGIFRNKFITAALILAVIVQVAVIHVPFLASAFRFEPLDIFEWLAIVAVTSSALWFGELYKLLKRT